MCIKETFNKYSYLSEPFYFSQSYLKTLYNVVLTERTSFRPKIISQPLYKVKSVKCRLPNFQNAVWLTLTGLGSYILVQSMFKFPSYNIQ